MTEKLKKLLDLVTNKKVHLICHYDADGVASGALLYHLIKDVVKSIHTLSKGLIFKVEPEDIFEGTEIVIISDIKPSERLPLHNVIYVDHHPDFSEVNENDYLFRIFNTETQSCSLLVWQELIPETNNPYFIFLTLMGYFGDGGDREAIPHELFFRAQELLTTTTKFGLHNIMQRKPSFFGDGEYLEIEKYVSGLNTGKRMHWSGDIPLELLKSINCFRPYIYNMHPIAGQIKGYKQKLKELYNMKVELNDIRLLQYGIIQCDKNIQGVLCARLMKNKPILIMNKYQGIVVASMRVPDHIDFDAGAYLDGISGVLDSVVGGGHEKAGGVTFPINDLPKVLDVMHES